MKITTYFGELMRLAKAEAAAKKSGDREEIDRAVKEHEAYKELCLKADKMIVTSHRWGDL